MAEGAKNGVQWLVFVAPPAAPLNGGYVQHAVTAAETETFGDVAGRITKCGRTPARGYTRNDRLSKCFLCVKIVTRRKP